MSQFVVFIGYYVAGIVRTEGKLHLIVFVGPIGMVVLLFGGNRHLRHKRKCLTEIIKYKGGFEAVIGFFPKFHDIRFRFSLNFKRKIWILPYINKTTSRTHPIPECLLPASQWWPVHPLHEPFR